MSACHIGRTEAYIGGNLAVGVDKALEWETMIENCFRERPAELALLFCCKLSLREIPPDVFFLKQKIMN